MIAWSDPDFHSGSIDCAAMWSFSIGEADTYIKWHILYNSHSILHNTCWMENNLLCSIDARQHMRNFHLSISVVLVTTSTVEPETQRTHQKIGGWCTNSPSLSPQSSPSRHLPILLTLLNSTESIDAVFTIEAVRTSLLHFRQRYKGLLQHLLVS